MPTGFSGKIANGTLCLLLLNRSGMVRSAWFPVKRLTSNQSNDICVYLCHRPVAFFLLFWKKHGFEVKRREKLPSNTFPIFSAWRKITKTKRRKLALKRRKMALKQHKILGTIRNTYFFSETTCFLPNGKNYCSFGKRHFFCEPGWYRYFRFVGAIELIRRSPANTQ